MSKKPKIPEILLTAEEWTQNVVNQAVVAVSKKFDEVDTAIGDVGKKVATLEGELHNGLFSKVSFIWTIQWVQISILIAVLSALIGGLWWMTQQSAVRNQKILDKIEKHMEDGKQSGVDQRLDRRTHNPEGEGSSPSPAIGGVAPLTGARGRVGPKSVPPLRFFWGGS